MKSVVGSLCLLAGLLYVQASSMLPLNKDECVYWHNKYRAMHQAPKVKWSKDLAAKAQTYANELARKNIFKHGSAGENLYMSSRDSKNACENGIKAFYKEEKLYNYNNPGFTKETGHFTQLVWIASNEIGVGKAMRADKKIVLVYRYKPYGNVNDRKTFEKNVKPSTVGKGVIHQSSVVYCIVFGLIAMGLGVTMN